LERNFLEGSGEIVRRKWRKLKKKTDMAESLILPTLQITVNQVDITAVQIKSETERR
jgi:hypothetical protein